MIILREIRSFGYPLRKDLRKHVRSVFVVCVRESAVHVRFAYIVCRTFYERDVYRSTVHNLQRDLP